MRSVAIAVAIIITACSASISEEVPPRSLTEQQHARPSESQPNAQEMQAPAAPSVPQISVSQPHGSSPDTSIKRPERNSEQLNWIQKFLYDIKVTDVLLVVFTALLALYTGRLWYATAGLWESAKEQARDMKASIAEAKRSADATEAAFTKLERPYVYIFGAHRFVATGSGAGTAFAVANYGKTPATIRIIAAGISFFTEPLDGLIVDYRDDPEHSLLVRPIMPPGDVRDGLFVLAPGNLPLGGGFDKFGNPLPVVPQVPSGERAFVWIRIQYQGPFGDGYITSACWCYDDVTDRLVEWGGDEYNYVR